MREGRREGRKSLLPLRQSIRSDFFKSAALLYCKKKKKEEEKTQGTCFTAQRGVCSSSVWQMADHTLVLYCETHNVFTCIFVEVVRRYLTLT